MRVSVSSVFFFSDCVIGSIAVPIGQVSVELPLIYINGLLYYGPCNSLN